LKVPRLSSFFFDDDAYAFTSTRRNFSTTTQGIRLRRVDVFSTTSDATRFLFYLLSVLYCVKCMFVGCIKDYQDYLLIMREYL